MRLSYRFRDIIAYFPKIKDSHVTVTTPLSGTICRRKAWICYDQHAHQIWSL